MNRHLQSNKGLTLIELLIALALTAMISTIIYSVFVTGIKLYQKIAIEGQLRDDADYIATMILNEFYEKAPNYIDEYTNLSEGISGIRLVRYKPSTVNRYIVEQSSEIDEEVYIYYKDKIFYIENFKNGVSLGKQEISVVSSQISSLSDGQIEENSFIKLNQCNSTDAKGNCTHGIISLNLVLDDSKNRASKLLKVEPMVLKSTFGF